LIPFTGWARSAQSRRLVYNEWDKAWENVRL
jgi:hypothetical protein